MSSNANANAMNAAAKAKKAEENAAALAQKTAKNAAAAANAEKKATEAAAAAANAGVPKMSGGARRSAAHKHSLRRLKKAMTKMNNALKKCNKKRMTRRRKH